MNHSSLYASIFAALLFVIVPIMEPAKGNLHKINPTTAQESYCNTRFDFCVSFPDNIFTEKELSTNGDGAIFSTPNNEIVMNISGEYDVLNRNIRDHMELLLSAIERPTDKLDDHTTVLGENHFISLIDQEDRQLYVRSHKYGNHFVNIVVRINDKSFLKELNLDEEIQLVVSI